MTQGTIFWLMVAELVMYGAAVPVADGDMFVAFGLWGSLHMCILLLVFAGRALWHLAGVLAR